MAKISRRKFIPIVVGGAIALGATAYGYDKYFKKSTGSIPTESPKINNPPVADFQIVKPKYILPAVGQEVHLRSASSDPDGDLLIQRLYINDELELETDSKDLKFKFKESGTNQVRLEVTDGHLTDYKESNLNVEPNQIYPLKQFNVRYKGISYYIAPIAEWKSPLQSREKMIDRLETIKNDLGCNAVIITAGGEFENHLIECGELAIETGFDRIEIQPRYMHATVDETVERLGEFATKVKELREASQAIIYSIGHEFGLETSIMKGSTWNARLESSFKGEWSKVQSVLPGMIRKIIKVCNENYGYSISYSAIAQEAYEHLIPWDDPIFDSIGVDTFLQDATGWDESWYSNLFSKLKRYGKPIHSTEWGCMTYTGAGYYGGMAIHPKYWQGKRYDEDEQADYIERCCNMLNNVKIDGSFYSNIADDAVVGDDIYYGLLNGRNRKKGFYMYKSYQIA